MFSWLSSRRRVCVHNQQNSKRIEVQYVEFRRIAIRREMGSHRFRLIKKPPKGGYSIGLRISCQPLQSGQ